LPEEEGVPEPPSELKAKGREFWSSVFDNGSWLWKGVDCHLVAHTAELMDERQELRELTDQQPDNTRLRATLRQLDKQLVSNLSLLGFTPWVSAGENPKQAPGVVGAQAWRALAALKSYGTSAKALGYG
jgi:hypothetical protein